MFSLFGCEHSSFAVYSILFIFVTYFKNDKNYYYVSNSIIRSFKYLESNDVKEKTLFNGVFYVLKKKKKIIETAKSFIVNNMTSI